MKNQQFKYSYNFVRTVIIVSLLFLLFCIISVLVSTVSENIYGICSVFVIGLIITPVMASPIEWVGHKYICHRNFKLLRRIYSIHSIHHHLHFPAGRYIASGLIRRIPIIRKDVNTIKNLKVQNALTYLAQMFFYTILGAIFICLPAGLLSKNLSFLLGTVVGTLVISYLFIFVHDTVHRPGRYKIIENQKWFLFLDNHHYIHHIDTEVNFNFLLPLADWLFCTLRKKLTTEELIKYGERATAQITAEVEPSNEARKHKIDSNAIQIM